MKRSIVFALAVVLLAACSTKEIDIQTPDQDDVVFYASFEQPADEGTRVYANEDLRLRWTADDRVSIFNTITYNQEYKFTGETGDNSGSFSPVKNDFITGNTIPHVVSVYPYLESTRITEDEVLTVTLPAEQTYAVNSFGLGANTMVSVSDNNVLQFKNVGGYLVLKLFGEGVTVTSITLKGNNGEKLAGKALVTMPLNGVPSVEMTDEATTEITLICETPVQLGATEMESTHFWFVVPPVTFDKGFTIYVNQITGGVFEKSTIKTITVERSNLSKMSGMEVENNIQPNNVIYYTTYDDRAISANGNFGSLIVSDEYVDGRGIITFDGAVTNIGDGAFSNCYNLISIELPNSVTSIGNEAFYNCNELTSINMPNSLTSIGIFAFYNCSGLTSIDLPNSLTSIAPYAFEYCHRLTSIEIPNSVTSLGSDIFFGCSSLASIIVESGNPVYDSRDNCNAIIKTDTNTLIVGCKNTIIPKSVTGIGRFAFILCSGLISIQIPNSITNIGYNPFSGCSSLASIIVESGNPVYDSRDNCNAIIKTDTNTLIVGCKNTVIPKSVTNIGDYAFSNCYNLTSIEIPNSVTSIGADAFFRCYSLTSIKMSNSITNIGDHAFESCESLSSIEIPNSVTSIGAGAFIYCSGLTSIEIPSSVSSIGNFAFQECSGLISITVYGTVPPAIDFGTFRYTNDCPIYVPAESVDAYKSTMNWRDYADRIHALAPLPEAVDLGLSVKWASFNLGASKPEEYGDYYAWGELTSKDLDAYTQSNYKYYEDGAYTKYIASGKMVLDTEDDAASVLLGDHWRIPSREEYLELFDVSKNSVSWTTLNGVVGWTVESRTNGNSFFIPAGGQRREGNPYDAQGQFAFAWTRDLYPYNDTYAYALCLYDITVGTYLAPKSYINETGNLWREMGLPIRPVYAE